ncbi:MAG: hypothetical protein AVDCRST_MAG68-428, partial [uncultured Gemmatimonadetes bacterium]
GLWSGGCDFRCHLRLLGRQALEWNAVGMRDRIRGECGSQPERAASL